MDMKELQSNHALVCKSEHQSDAGGAIIWFVCMADGFLLNCGHGSKSNQRAKDVAAAINSQLIEDIDDGQ